MKIINLVEDTKGIECCEAEHGLCFYIETHKHCLLVDTGATDMLMRNAKALNVDLSKVDMIILSHGHYDHSGGIMAMNEVAPDARIYMRETAALDYYHDERYIGIDKRISDLRGVVLTDEFLRIDDELLLFSGITGRRSFAKSNLLLSKKVDGKLIQDSFDHEQCLVIADGKRKILISGCAHNGILNVLDRYRELFDSLPDVVISGFHMMKKSEYTPDEIETIKSTARELRELDIEFRSGHCTGKPAFDIMKEIMGDKLKEIHSGDVIIDD